MSNFGLYEWVKLGGMLFGILYLAIGVIIYVWKDDRRTLQQKVDRAELDEHRKDNERTFREYRRQFSSDIDLVRADIRELRNIVISGLGENHPHQSHTD